MADLATLAAIKDDLGIDQAETSDDARLKRLITSLSGQFESECGRVFSQATYTDPFEGSADRRAWRPDQGYTLRLVPKQWPVTSVTALTIEGQPVAQRTSSDVDGWIIRDGMYIDVVGLTALPITYGYAQDFRRSIISATYVAGYPTIPVDIAQALSDWVAWKYLREPRRTGVISATVSGGGESVTYSQWDKPLSTKVVIDRYKRRAVL
jgi:hypothetical protein